MWAPWLLPTFVIVEGLNLLKCDEKEIVSRFRRHMYWMYHSNKLNCYNKRKLCGVSTYCTELSFRSISKKTFRIVQSIKTYSNLYFIDRSI